MFSSEPGAIQDDIIADGIRLGRELVINHSETE